MTLAQCPHPRGLWSFAQRNRKVTREPQAGLGPLSCPTGVNLSPFPVSLDGFSWGMSASSKPRQMWVPSLWAGCVHTPGESGQGGMGRVQAAPPAQADLTPSAGSPPTLGQVAVSEQTCISAHSGSRSSSGQKQQPYWPGTAHQQGWLTVTVIAELPTGSADEGEIRSTSLMEGTDHHPPVRETQCRLQVSVITEGSAHWE